jgi:hypothetical protein
MPILPLTFLLHLLLLFLFFSPLPYSLAHGVMLLTSVVEILGLNVSQDMETTLIKVFQFSSGPPGEIQDNTLKWNNITLNIN